MKVVMSQAKAVAGVKNVLLIHGGFVDGSGWQGVYNLLKKDGYHVSIVQNPTISLADDVAVDEAHAGRAGRFGDSRRPFVRRRRDHGSRQRSQGRGTGLHRGLCAGQGRVGVGPDQEPAAWRARAADHAAEDGFLFLDRTKFRAAFAADVSEDVAAFMADSQVPWGLEALNGAVTEPAWKTKPSWYLVSTDDKMIPPDAQRAMSKRAGSTVVEVKGSHAVYVSQPRAVADLIAKAANGVALATR